MSDMSAWRCGQAPPKIHVALVLATAAASVQFASCNRLGAIGGESRRREREAPLQRASR